MTRACSLGELVENEPKRAVVEGRAVALVRIGDEVFAIEDRCSHADVALSEGDVDDHGIECFLHGSRFDLRTGKPSGLPAIRPVAVYPVTVEGEDVLVHVDQPSSAAS